MQGKHCKLSLRELSMSQLQLLIDKIKPTKSAGVDLISMKCVKINRKILEPLILHMANLTIKTEIFLRI
jgi:hypothetical protein